MTGLRPDTIGIYDLTTNFRTVDPNAATLPQAFIKAGYETSSLEKIFHVGHGKHEDAASEPSAQSTSKAHAYTFPESNRKPNKEHVIHVYPQGDKLGRAIRTSSHRLVDWKVPGPFPWDLSLSSMIPLSAPTCSG